MLDAGVAPWYALDNGVPRRDLGERCSRPRQDCFWEEPDRGTTCCSKPAAVAASVRPLWQVQSAVVQPPVAELGSFGG